MTPIGYEAPTVNLEKANALLETMRSARVSGEDMKVTYLEQLEGGWSRHSYAARVSGPDGESELILRARPRGSALDTDLGEEYRTFELLQDVDIAIPAVHGFNPSEDTPFTGPFFVMDRLPGEGVNIWRDRDQRLLDDDWNGDRGIANELVQSLATIHQVDVTGASGAVSQMSFVDLVDRWQGIYEEMRMVRDPVVEEAFAWVRNREPEEVEPCLVHGDYRIGNCLIDRGRITAILDWELSFIGDFRFDLGYLSMDYYAGKLLTPGTDLLNGVADSDWFLDRYRELTGREVDPEVVRTFEALGILMVYTIMTTGLHIYSKGESTDIRMAWTRFVLPSFRQDLVKLMNW